MDSDLRYWLEEARLAGLTDAPAAAPSCDGSAATGIAGLVAVERWIGACQRCPLAQSRRQIIYGEGNPDAELVFIGGAPDAADEASGRPFTGAAGELLTKMIEAGMKRPRSSVFITGLVKCRAPGDRQPQADEVAACMPFLRAQIAAVAPRVVVLLGAAALKGFRPDLASISQSRGQWIEEAGIAMLPTFHPAYLLRHPEAKRLAWADLQSVMERLRWS